MSLPWPEHLEHIPQEDREAFTEILTRLLAHNALIGDEGRERQLYLLARNDLGSEIESYFAVIRMSVFFDPDAPIIQLRPMDNAGGLSGRFNKAETLVLLTLWRCYHDIRMESVTHGVFLSVKDLWEKLKIFFEDIQPPNEGQLKPILQKFRRHRLIRMQRANDAETFDEVSLEILPTLQRTIPFEDVTAWKDQCELYRDGSESSGDGEEEEVASL
ncbi:DUF4194 domain-containing protein [Puniceicoccaceae bacterium K14]|nr:DUF4194 domain-containing protein [Puniceicoccaceae bacterium K14]